MLGDVMGVGISEGGIHCLLGRFADKAEPAYREIRRRVAASRVVGTDETGAKVNGERHWLWTWQTPNLTYIAHDPTRGKTAIEANFPDGFPNATLVHDGWRPQKGTPAENHQTCLAHLLRHLEYLGQRYSGHPWPRDFARLLRDAIEIPKEGGPPGPDIKRARIVQRLEGLLDRPPDQGLKELFTFYRRMCRERQQLFTFLYLAEVPPDNNASERAIRNVKVKQKISGQFKKDRTAQNFAKIRSVVDTTIKNGMNVLEALALIAKLPVQSTH